MTSEEQLALVERALEESLAGAVRRPHELLDAMRWAVEGGGKRLRPRLCLLAAEAAGGRAVDALNAAVAVELMHSYTLVHDDLPAMDNDAERRGKPSVWKQFGEANAILAADALQALAFAVAAKSARNASAVVAELADAGVGVVAGQVVDIMYADPAMRFDNYVSCIVPFIYRNKTARLFVAAASMGALAVGAPEPVVRKLGEFAQHLGMAFQYEDDLLDGDSSITVADIESRIRKETDLAVAALEGLPGPTAPLSALAESLVDREK